MELLPGETKIDFLKWGRLCGTLSSAAILISVVMWFVWGGFKLGIEFSGGTLLQFELPEEPAGSVGTGRVRDAMAAVGFPDAAVVSFGDPAQNAFQVSLKLSEEEATLQSVAVAGELEERAPVAGSAAESTQADTETDTRVRASAADAESGPDPAAETSAPPGEGEEPVDATDQAPPDGEAAEPADTAVAEEADGLVQEVVARLEAELGTPIRVDRIESIGPRVGSELARAGFEAVFLVSLLILVYIWLRFDLRYAPGAVVALLHDVLITAGVFVVFQLEFNLQVLAALLVILGYSLNDTIVVYDRIRENLELRGSTQLTDVVNQSVNQTLSRSLLTSMTTALVVVALLVLGGPVLRDFALALLIGIVVGTYSSIYVASALLVAIQKRWQYA